jgi:hypothetical protein
MTRPRLRRCLAILLLAPAGLARAHDFWIQPSTFRPQAGASVALGLRVGEAFAGEPFPRIPEYIERFVFRDAAGERPVAGRAGQEPAGLLRAARPGLNVALYESRPHPTEVEAAAFERYLKEEGLEPIAALRRRRGESGRPATERFSRCAKSLLRVGDAGGGRTRPGSAATRRAGPGSSSPRAACG